LPEIVSRHGRALALPAARINTAGGAADREALIDPEEFYADHSVIRTLFTLMPTNPPHYFDR
jgi:hypothetical protein